MPVPRKAYKGRLLKKRQAIANLLKLPSEHPSMEGFERSSIRKKILTIEKKFIKRKTEKIKVQKNLSKMSNNRDLEELKNKYVETLKGTPEERWERFREIHPEKKKGKR